MGSRVTTNLKCLSKAAKLIVFGMNSRYLKGFLLCKSYHWRARRTTRSSRQLSWILWQKYMYVWRFLLEIILDLTFRQGLATMLSLSRTLNKPSRIWEGKQGFQSIRVLYLWFDRFVFDVGCQLAVACQPFGALIWFSYLIFETSSHTLQRQRTWGMPRFLFLNLFNHLRRWRLVSYIIIHHLPMPPCPWRMNQWTAGVGFTWIIHYSPVSALCVFHVYTSFDTCSCSFH